MVRTVFLSHAGADTAAADALRKRLEGAGFDVWFDKRDLRAGHEVWQRQLEAQIDKVDGFVVYVGTGGVVNWVEAETRYALSRAISGERKLAFVPVLSAQVKGGSKALPGFARQFQAVRDVENDPAAWNRLVAGLTNGASPPKEEHPFFHLEPISADRNHLFFGRRHETAQIIDILRDRNLVLVAGASGSGKSSLVRAGMIPAWRGNAVGVRRGEDPEQGDWLTITMTPGDRPWENLGKAVIEAAEEERGLSPTQAAEFATLAQNDDPVVKERALRLNADPDKARVLLVVDQFEELFVRKSITPETRRSFAEFLARLADPRNPAFAVALTMRGDYTNHLANDPGAASLQARLQAQDGRARFTLRSILMSDPDNPAAGTERLRQVVTEPLALARWPEAEAEALADMVLRDTGGDAGDLALVQFALSETWAQRGNNGNDLLRSYASVGRVEGALAKSADKALSALFQNGLATEADAEAALIRLGSLVGTSPLRRTAPRSEFTEARWEALQFLASEEGKRLVQITGEGEAATAEIAHEALLTQWNTLNGWLSRDPEGKRLLDGFAQRALEAAEVAPRHRTRSAALTDFLLRAHGLEEPDPSGLVLSADDSRRYAPLLSSRPEWLTQAEMDFLRRSIYHDENVRKREARLPKVMGGWLGIIAAALVVVFVMMLGASALWVAGQAAQRSAEAARGLAEVERVRAERNEASALAGLAEVMIERKQGVRAGILALAALKSNPERSDPSRLLSVLDASIVSAIGENSFDRLPQAVSLDLSSDDQYWVTGDEYGKIVMWNADDFSFVRETPEMNLVSVTSLAVSSDDAFVAAGYSDGTLRLWELPDLNFWGESSSRHDGRILSIAISDDRRWVATGGSDRLIRQWSVPKVEPRIQISREVSYPVGTLQYSNDGLLLIYGSTNGILADLMISESGDLVNVNCDASADEILVSKTGMIVGICTPIIIVGNQDALVQEESRLTMKEPKIDSEPTTAVAVSASGDRIISGHSEGALRLWSGDDLRPLNVESLAPNEFGSPSGNLVRALAFSTDGKMVVSLQRDDTLWVRDAESLLLLGPQLRGFDGAAYDVRFSPNGRYIIASLVGGGRFIWDLSRASADRIALLCDHLAPRGQTEIEAIEAEYGLKLPPICTPEQRAILLSPLYVPPAP